MSVESTSPPARPEAPASRGRRTAADLALGLVGGAMVLVAVVLLFVGGEPDGAEAAATDVPALELLQPRNGAEIVTDRLVVVFRATEDLQQSAMGWGAGGLHLHLDLNGTEVMPAASDIERLPSGTYRWTLPLPQPGLHTLRLLWSGPDHQPLSAGASRVVQVKIEE